MGDPPWGCGWGGGRGCGIRAEGWGEGERLACPYEPCRGPGTGGVGGSRPERPACGRSRGGPGTRRPAPGGLLPDPPGLRGPPPLSRGLRREPPSGLDRTLPRGPAGEEGARRVRPSAQRSGCWSPSVVLCPSPSPLGSSLRLPRGALLLPRVCHQILWQGDFSSLLSREGDTCLKDRCPRHSCPLKSFPSVDACIPSPDHLMVPAPATV